MPAPSISVVIPHLNQPEHLRRCLGSLRDQAFDTGRYEIIVVDNGSAALPSEICEAFGARLEVETTPGPGPARNTGVGVARGDMLAFTDADCIADPNWLSAIAAAFADDKINVIGGNVRIALVDPGRPTMLEAYESIYSFRQKMYVERQGYAATLNLAMRRRAFDAVGPFAGIDLAEDYDWGQRATKIGYAPSYVPDMLVFHPARTSTAELRRKLDRTISHDFQAVRGIQGYARWLARALAIGVSPVTEIPRIWRSARAATWRERGLAAFALVLFRTHRAARMLTLVASRSARRGNRSWNRLTHS